MWLNLRKYRRFQKYNLEYSTWNLGQNENLRMVQIKFASGSILAENLKLDDFCKQNLWAKDEIILWDWRLICLYPMTSAYMDRTLKLPNT